VAGSLEPFDQQPLGAFDRYRRPLAERAQRAVEVGESCDVVVDPRLESTGALLVEDTQLVVLSASVDADEHAGLQVRVIHCGPPGWWKSPSGRSFRSLIQVLEARLPLAGSDQPPPGGAGLPLDLEGHVAKALSRWWR
jgi:hypothetical protein